MNRLLLDTHVVLWWSAAPDLLTDDSRQQIEAPDTELWVSAASFWELSIKHQLGKIRLPANLASSLRRHGANFIDITVEHSLAAGALPRIHRDPFDRMLIAQARIEKLTLVTRDPHIPQYQVRTLIA